MTMGPPFLSLALPRRASPSTPPRRTSTYPLTTPSKVTPAAAVSSACASRRSDVDCYGVGYGSAASTLLSRVASSRRHSMVGAGGKDLVAPSPEMKSAGGADEMMADEHHYDMLDSPGDGGLRWDDVIRGWPGNDTRGMSFRLLLLVCC
jgi:hypothetical protein